jgi:hypothetical protein
MPPQLVGAIGGVVGLCRLLCSLRCCFGKSPSDKPPVAFNDSGT